MSWGGRKSTEWAVCLFLRWIKVYIALPRGSEFFWAAVVLRVLKTIFVNCSDTKGHWVLGFVLWNINCSCIQASQEQRWFGLCILFPPLFRHKCITHAHLMMTMSEPGYLPILCRTLLQWKRVRVLEGMVEGGTKETLSWQAGCLCPPPLGSTQLLTSSLHALWPWNLQWRLNWCKSQRPNQPLVTPSVLSLSLAFCLLSCTCTFEGWKEILFRREPKRTAGLCVHRGLYKGRELSSRASLFVVCFSLFLFPCEFFLWIGICWLCGGFLFVFNMVFCVAGFLSVHVLTSFCWKAGLLWRSVAASMCY